MKKISESAGSNRITPDQAEALVNNFKREDILIFRYDIPTKDLHVLRSSGIGCAFYKVSSLVNENKKIRYCETVKVPYKTVSDALKATLNKPGMSAFVCESYVDLVGILKEYNI